MRYVRQAGSDPSFLLKALGEAAGELHRAFDGLPHREWRSDGVNPDEGWCLLAIPYHALQVEKGVQKQIETILSTRESDMRNVDMDDIPFREDYYEEDIEELLEEFHYLRRRSTYLLWDIDERDWQRGGNHPYRGRVTVLELAREMYQHDLEHLWQARRMMDRIAAGSAR